MKKVTIYIKPACPFCKKALVVLKRLGVEPRIIDLTAQPTLKQEMVTITGRTSVPQIFFGNEHIGGCDDLLRLKNIEEKLNE